MDITQSTKDLISKVQTLKSKYSDLSSTLFIDFYCQCKEGCDYLFPKSVKESIRLLDILQWFFDSFEKGEPTILVQLMWQDIVGPTLGEFQRDEKIERKLWKAFSDKTFKASLQNWDRESRLDGGVNLILRELLTEIDFIEKEHQEIEKKRPEMY